MINLIQGLIDNQPNEFHLEIIKDFDAHTVTTKVNASLKNITIDTNKIIFEVTKPTISECIDEVISFSNENNIEFPESHLEVIRIDQAPMAKFIFDPPLK